MWTAEEEDAVRAGVHRHGEGKWSLILKDYGKVGGVLEGRSSVNVKDKWRNMNKN